MSRHTIRSSARSACRIRLRAIALIVAMAALLPASAWSADDTEGGALADTTKPAMIMRETVVTGARYQRELYRHPQSVSLMTRRQIRQMLAPVPGDALSLVPGVNLSKDSPWNQQPVVRGMAGQRVLMLVDGVPMNNARGRGPQPSLVGTEDIARMEVVRGPGSVAYGSDALGGVINIITREAPAGGSDGVTGSIGVGGSTVDDGTNVFMNVVPRLGNLSGFVSGSLARAEDYESPTGKIQDSGYESGAGLVNLRYDFTPKTALKAGYQMYRADDIGIPGLTVSVPGYSQEFRFKDYDRNFAHTTLEHAYSNSWLDHTSIRGFWQQEKRNFQSDILINTASPFTPDFLEQNKDRFFDLQTWGLQFQATSPRTETTQFTFGLDFARDITGGTNVEVSTWRDSSGAPTPGPGPPGTPASSTVTTMSVPEGDFDSYAGYLQSEWFTTNRLTLSAGARYTYYRYETKEGVSDPSTSPPTTFEALSVKNGAFSGSVGAVYEAVENVFLTANVANGYRQPNAQDLFFDGPASVGVVLGNPDLDPERSISYDAGVRWAPGDVALSASIFYSSYNDLIDAVRINTTASASTDSFRYFNIAEARVYGVEAEGVWQVHPQVRARAALSGAVGDITSSDAIMMLYGIAADEAPLPSVAPFGGNVGLRVADASRRFWVEPSARFSSKYDRLPLAPPGLEEFVRPKAAWMAADLFLGAIFPSGQRITLGVRNITDARYEPALSSVEEAGRSFVGSVSTDF